MHPYIYTHVHSYSCTPIHLYTCTVVHPSTPIHLHTSTPIHLYIYTLYVTSLNYVARPPGLSDPNLDQNYDIFVGTILAFNANVLHAPNRVRSEVRKDPSVTLFFGCTSLSNRNIVLAILLLAGDVHPNSGPINRETIHPCGYCQQHVGWSCSGVGCETCNVWYHRECVSITHSHYLALNNSAHVWICFKCQTPKFSNSSISITGSPEINFNSQNSFAVLSDLTGKDDVFLRSPVATLFNPPLFSTPTGDTSSFSNIRYTLSSSEMSNSTSSNISNSQIKKSQSWRTLVININSAPGKRAELENLINYTDPDLIIMTETKIDEQVKASEFLPKGYTGEIRKDRCKGGGGVLITTKQEYDIQRIELEANISAETVWVTISLKDQRKLVVGSYYRPPDSGSDSIDDLESVLSFITEKF